MESTESAARSHPSDDDLAELIDGGGNAAWRADVTAHLDECEPCRMLVAGAAGDEGPSPKKRGDVLGRYVVIEGIGSGAMGVVYAAYDPDLDRRVALKLLRADGRDDAREALKARLLREARSLAKLSHPNVVAVHDVGAVGDEVFLAMELIKGTTLRGYLSASARSVDEIMRVLAAAGEGLAAAHEAGVVHRDFKPDNVLVGEDGRVRVADFGLARRGHEDVGTPVLSAVGDEGRSRLTRTGALAGTPAYMAPEQLAGGPATAASDQYAFAVAFRDALLEHSTAREGGAKTRGPAAVRAVLQRALSADPSKRFSSMRALLDALGATRRRPFRTIAIASGVGVVVLAAASALMLAARRPEPCAASATSFAAAWGPAIRDSVRSAFERSTDGATRDMFASVDRELTRYAERYVAADRDACLAARAVREPSAATFDRRAECLSGRLREAVAFTSSLTRATQDPTVASHATDAARALPDVAVCANADVLAAIEALPADPGARKAVVELDDAISRETVSVNLGGAVASEPRLRVLAARAAELHRERSRGRALLALAVAEMGASSADPRPTAREAVKAALVAKDDDLLVDAWLYLADAEAYYQRIEHVDEIADLVAAVSRRLGRDPIREAKRLLSIARVRSRTGRDLDHAFTVASEAYDLLVAALGPDDVYVALAESSRGGIRFHGARYDEALVHYRHSLEISQAIYGPDHRHVDDATANYAETLVHVGRAGEARDLLRAVVSHRHENPHILDSYAVALEATGDRTAALGARREVLVCCDAMRSQSCTRWALARLGTLLVLAGQDAEATEILTRALAMDADILPADVANATRALETARARSGRRPTAMPR